MTSSALPVWTPRRRRWLRADRLRAALIVAALVGLLALAALGPAGAAPPSRAAGVAPRVALVVDAGPDGAAALERAGAAAARAERSGGADVAVRVPRTAAQAAVDVRYFAAQRYAA